MYGKQRNVDACKRLIKEIVLRKVTPDDLVTMALLRMYSDNNLVDVRIFDVCSGNNLKATASSYLRPRRRCSSCCLKFSSDLKRCH